jgi:uncharacterized protein
MLLVDTTLGPSSINGLGCFTNQRIRQGETVWLFDQRIDFRLPLAAVGDLPWPAQDFFHKYGYVEVVGGERVVTLCGDHAKHMNHSDDPNLVSLDEEIDSNIAARDIEEGEELTCDYYSFDLDAERKLGERGRGSPVARS